MPVFGSCHPIKPRLHWCFVVIGPSTVRAVSVLFTSSKQLATRWASIPAGHSVDIGEKCGNGYKTKGGSSAFLQCVSSWVSALVVTLSEETDNTIEGLLDLAPGKSIMNYNFIEEVTRVASNVRWTY